MNNSSNQPDSLILRRRRKIDADIDITPMIDCVFLLLIFFLVCSTLGKSSIVQLPKAKYGVGVNPKTATVLTLVGSGKDVIVYLGDEITGRELPSDRNQQEAEIIQAVERGVKDGKNEVVIRADKKLHHGEVVRVEAAATIVHGVSLYVIVDDKRE